MKTYLLTAVCLAALAGNNAYGQVYNAALRTQRTGYPGPRYYFGSPRHASTVAESYARGYADLIRSQGMYNVMSSQAMINLMEAQRRAMENRVVQTEAYFQMKQINRSYRGRGRAKRTQRQVALHARKNAVTNTEEPKRVYVHAGGIDWPKAVQHRAFEAERKTVQLIVQRVDDCGGVAEESDKSQLAEACQVMISKLRDRVHECSPQEYVDAKCFLGGISCPP